MNLIYIHNLDPAFIRIGPFQPRWYAIMYLLGFALCYRMISRHKDFLAMGKTADDAMDFVTYCFFGVMLGGRMGYVLFYNLPMYLNDPLEIFKIWHGGMAFHGALIGTMLGGALYCYKKKVPYWVISDIAIVPITLGLFFGRIGNFINGELWGKPTDGTWGVNFANTGGGDMLRHPTQLYEALLEGLVLFTLLSFCRRFLPLKPGGLVGIFLIGYGFARSLVEFYRIPDPQMGYLYGGWMTMGHVLCIPMVLIGLLILTLSAKGKLGQSIGHSETPVTVESATAAPTSKAMAAEDHAEAASE